MDDLISRAYVLAEYDRQHQGPPGGARKIMEEAPTVPAITVEWLIQMQDKLRSAVAAHSNISGNSMDILQAISAVLELWEQEAR